MCDTSAITPVLKLRTFEPLARYYQRFIRAGHDPEVQPEDWDDYDVVVDTLAELVRDGEFADPDDLEHAVDLALRTLRRIVVSKQLFDGTMDLCDVPHDERRRLFQNATRLLLADTFFEVDAVHAVVHTCASDYPDCSRVLRNVQRLLDRNTIVSPATLENAERDLTAFLTQLKDDDEIRVDFRSIVVVEVDSEEEATDNDEGDGYLKTPDWRGSDESQAPEPQQIGSSISSLDTGEPDMGDEDDESSEATVELLAELPLVLDAYRRAYSLCE
ncbi:MAG: hypothetical protein U0136_21000 [Bdellovibrionota bacterium]